MKLSSKTKNLVNIGTILTQAGMDLKVVNMWEVGNGKQLTVEILSHPKAEYIGHLIYGEPMTWFYGMNIK